MRITEKREFNNIMNKWEKLAGFGYLPIHVFGLPILLALYVFSSGDDLSDVLSNGIYYGIGLIFILIFNWRYLRKSFDTLLDNKSLAIMSAAAALLAEFVMSYIAALCVIFLAKDMENPNDAVLIELARQDFEAVILLSVLVGPIVEEILFRGVLFGSIRQKNRLLAYIASVLIFSFYHLWQYLLIEPSLTTLVFAIQYIPAGIALAWCYERTGCIWVPIIVHSAVNAGAFILL